MPVLVDRLSRLLRSAFAAALALGMFSASAGLAQTPAGDQADWKLCMGDKPDGVIEGCARLLAGKLDAKAEATALGNRGWGYNQKGDFDKSLTDYLSCLKAVPGDEYCLTELSDTYNLRKDYDKAVQSADAALKANPKSEYAHYDKGYALFRKGNYDLAIASFSAAIDLNPRFDKAYYQRGQAEAYKLDYAAAIADDAKALAIDPLYDDARAARAFAEYSTGKLDAAQVDLDPVIARNPKAAWSLGIRGLVFAAKGNDSKALADFDAALAVDPAADWIYTPRGVAKFHLKKFADVIPDLQHVVGAFPGSLEANAYLGLALVETGKKDEAKGPLHAALDTTARTDNERKAQRQALEKLTEIGVN